jgi:hypothetical protein
VYIEPFNVTNIDHNEGPKTKRAPPPPQKNEVQEIEPVIVEHASQCTVTSFC